jgi:protein gp37
MADNSGIEWTDATWNPVVGCSVISPGCTNCYAMKLAGGRMQNHPSRQGLTKPSKAGPVWTGEVRFMDDWLDQPLRWKRPRKIFVCAHSDLFHEAVPDEWIDKVFAVMALAPQHTFQVLTKRPERMRSYLTNGGALPWLRARISDAAFKVNGVGSAWRAKDAPWPLENVHLGVSAEDQPRADERIPLLLATPAAVRWVSAEPLLGPIWMATNGRFNDGDGAHSWLTGARFDVDVDANGVTGGPHKGPRLDWVVAGGESGPGARPSHPDWFRSLRDQCASAGVPFHFKQHGDWREWDSRPETDEVDAGSEAAEAILASAHNPAWITRDGRVFHQQEDLPPDTPCRLVERLGKKAAGRLLDGREHNGMPGHG